MNYLLSNVKKHESDNNNKYNWHVNINNFKNKIFINFTALRKNNP